MAWVAKTSDSFNRANGALGGSTLDNAGGGAEANTWTVKVGTWTVTGNQARCASTDANYLVIVDSTAAVGDMRVTTPTAQQGTGQVARYVDVNNYYLSYRVVGAPTNLILYKLVAGSFTQLGSTFTSLAGGNFVSPTCVGTSISVSVNGTTQIGPVTDSAHATGRPGMFGGDSAASVLDDFLYETDVAGGSPPPYRRHPMSHMLVR